MSEPIKGVLMKSLSLWCLITVDITPMISVRLMKYKESKNGPINTIYEVCFRLRAGVWVFPWGRERHKSAKSFSRREAGVGAPRPWS